MARKAKFFVAHWAPLNEAFARAKTALGSSTLAELDLVKDMRTGRLPSGMRRVARDGSETFQRLRPEFWGGLTLVELHDDDMKRSGSIQVRGLDAKLIVGARLYFFVARRDLDKVYPGSAESGAHRDNVTVNDDAAPADDVAPPPPRRPGPAPRREWPIHVASELIRLAKAGEEPPPASYFAAFCHDKIGYEPDIRAIQRLLKKLL